MSPILAIDSSVNNGQTLKNIPTIFNENFFTPTGKNTPQTITIQRLTNPKRYREIYDLRVSVWENSGNSTIANRKIFPNGWCDEMDKTAFHWAAVNEQNKIIAAARVNIFENIRDFPYHSSIKHLELPSVVPFAFFSRLIVHPGYRQSGLSRKLFSYRTTFCKEQGVQWSQVFINNPHIIQLYEKAGYKNIGHAEVSYHTFCKHHDVQVLLRK